MIVNRNTYKITNLIIAFEVAGLLNSVDCHCTVTERAFCSLERTNSQ